MPRIRPAKPSATYRHKRPSLRITKKPGPVTRLRYKAGGFAERIRGTSMERRNNLFEKIRNSIDRSREKEQKLLELMENPKEGKLKSERHTTAMFQFLEGVEKGIIPETDEVRKIAGEIVLFSNGLAKELGDRGVKYSRKDERSVNNLLWLLTEEIQPHKSGNQVLDDLLIEKRKIEKQIQDFVEREYPFLKKPVEKPIS